MNDRYIEPSEDPLHNEFVNRVVGNAIPPNLIPAVEAGFREACERGSLTGHRVQGVRMVCVIWNTMASY